MTQSLKSSLVLWIGQQLPSQRSKIWYILTKNFDYQKYLSVCWVSHLLFINILCLFSRGVSLYRRTISCLDWQSVFSRCTLAYRTAVCFIDVPYFFKPFLLSFRSLGLTRKNKWNIRYRFNILIILTSEWKNLW